MCRLPAALVPYATPRNMWGLLALGLGILTLMSLYIQFVVGAIPCQMCWWQRYAHYGLLALGLVGAAWPTLSRWLLVVAVPVACAGLAVAVWQVAAQQGWLPFPATCTSHGAGAAASAGDLLAAMQTVNVIPCDRENFRVLGLTLATWNTPIMLAALAWLGGVWHLVKPHNRPI